MPKEFALPRYTYACERCDGPRRIGQPKQHGDCNCAVGFVSMPNLLAAMKASETEPAEAGS